MMNHPARETCGLRRVRLGVLSLGALCSAFAMLDASAHHSPFVHYEARQIVEIEGTVKAFEWRNPHTRFTVIAKDANGRDVEWNMEYSPPAILLRQGVTKHYFQIGTKMRFAGFKAAGSNTMFVTNILLPDGRENYNDEYASPRWVNDTSKKVGEGLIAYQNREIGGEKTPPPMSIFHVWANDFRNPTPNKLFASASDYALTPWAAGMKARWDPVKDNPYIFCHSGLPVAMDEVHPLRFTQEGDNIRLDIEEYDVHRLIHMKNAHPPARGASAGPFGYSVGHWEGKTLVVETGDIDYPWFDKKGTPETLFAHLSERFTPSADYSRLEYSVIATDPNVFEAPVTLKREWIWVPGETIKPYHCSFNKDDLGVVQGERR